MKLGITIVAAMLGFMAMLSLAVAASHSVPVDADGQVITITADAHGDTETPPEAKPGDTFVELVLAVKNGHWRMAASLALVLLMLGIRRFRDKLPYLKGDRGGAILVGIMGLAGALSAALATDAALDYKLVLGALGATWMAVGGYTWVKKILWPKD